MTTRLLQGARRTDDGRWQWGCWEITPHTDDRFWIAVDTETDFGDEPHYYPLMDRVQIAPTCRLSDLRWFLWGLAELGPAPLTAEQVREREADYR